MIGNDSSLLEQRGVPSCPRITHNEFTKMRGIYHAVCLIRLPDL